MKVVKNKMAPPFREAEFDINFGEGISREGDVPIWAAENGIIEKSGAWLFLQGGPIGHGRDNSRVSSRKTHDTWRQVEKDVRASRASCPV